MSNFIDIYRQRDKDILGSFEKGYQSAQKKQKEKLENQKAMNTILKKAFIEQGYTPSPAKPMPQTFLQKLTRQPQKYVGDPGSYVLGQLQFKKPKDTELTPKSKQKLAYQKELAKIKSMTEQYKQELKSKRRKQALEEELIQPKLRELGATREALIPSREGFISGREPEGTFSEVSTAEVATRGLGLKPFQTAAGEIQYKEPDVKKQIIEKVSKGQELSTEELQVYNELIKKKSEEDLFSIFDQGQTKTKSKYGKFF